MKEDIQNSSPTVMFRGTPCSKTVHQLSCFVGHPVVKQFTPNVLKTGEKIFLKRKKKEENGRN